MADGEAPIPNPELPCQLPAVEISDAFIEHFHWSHSSDAPSLTEIPSNHQFSEDMVEEIQGAAALAFERAILEDANTQSITLFCPHEGGHPFVDSMVKMIASHQKADVVVLDALVLATVQFGPMGEGTLYFVAMTALLSQSFGSWWYYRFVV
jgi:hypothetical protein